MEVYIRDNKTKTLQIGQYDLHPEMATHISQVKILEKKFPSQFWVIS